MKRNMYLARAILLHIEADEKPNEYKVIEEIEDYSFLECLTKRVVWHRSCACVVLRCNDGQSDFGGEFVATGGAGPASPKPRRKKYPGRKPISNRQALTGILFVLKTGIPWGYLPQELGCGSGMTCWRRLRDWQAAGVWEELHQLLLEALQQQGALDWSVAVADSSSVRAVGAGKKPAQVR